MHKIVKPLPLLTRTSKYSFTLYHPSNKQISWQNKYNGAFLRFPIQKYNTNMLFFIHKQMKFKHLASGMMLDGQAFKFPAGVDLQSNIMEFLGDWQNPGVVQISYEEYRKPLMNRASQKDSVIVKDAIKNPNSIYAHLNNYIQKNPSETAETGDINYFLNHFYLRLAAQTYCLIQKVNTALKMTPKVLGGILHFIGEQYENTTPADIKKLQRDINIVRSKIAMSEDEKEKILREGERVVKLYKYGAILVTGVHIVTFGYMIFFVEWLGWDIIEPLTYTVGVIYTLLGIRFYKKYNANRNYQNIKQALIRMTLKPQRLIKLKEIGYRIELHKKQLKRLECKFQILNNRINFKTSLCENLRGLRN